MSDFSLSASQVVSIHVNQSHGHLPTWPPTFHPLIVWFPQFRLPSQSLKNPLAQAHPSASDLVREHRMTNFPASLWGASCLLITYELTHPPSTCTYKHKKQINKQSQGLTQRSDQSPQWCNGCKIPWVPRRSSDAKMKSCCMRLVSENVTFNIQIYLTHQEVKNSDNSHSTMDHTIISGVVW